MMKRIAVLGCGYWGKNLVRNFHVLESLAAVCDPSASGRERAEQIAPGVAVHADVDSVLADDSIDGVVIATPAATHAALTTRALEAGKDVLCEKPLALRYDEAAAVARLAAERERILAVGHILEYHGAVLALRSLIERGDLGELRYVYSNRLNLGKVRTEENTLWSLAPHDVSIILRLFGESPTTVAASGPSFVTPGVHDVTVLRLSFASGVGAHVFVSWLNPFKEQRLVVVGSERMATFDGVTAELVVHDQRVDLEDGVPSVNRGPGHRVEYDAGEPLAAECRAFLEAIETREGPISDAASALSVLAVLDAASHSLENGGAPERVPAAQPTPIA